MASSIRSKMRCALRGLMYETASKRVYKSKRCVLFMTFRPSQRTFFMARRNWVPLALRRREIRLCEYLYLSFVTGTVVRRLKRA